MATRNLHFKKINFRGAKYCRKFGVFNLVSPLFVFGNYFVWNQIVLLKWNEHPKEETKHVLEVNFSGMEKYDFGKGGGRDSRNDRP